MNSKQQAFVEAYCCNGFNATQAAITAGYSEKTAKSQGGRLLTNVDIDAHIKQFKSKGAERALVTIEDVVKGFLKEATGEQTDTTSPARNAAWKELSNFTGGFDANVRKVAVDTDVVFNMAFGGNEDES
jgi:phage terminase small subunit